MNSKPQQQQLQGQRVVELWRERATQLEDLEKRVRLHTLATDPETVIREQQLADYLRANVQKLGALARIAQQSQTIAAAKTA